MIRRVAGSASGIANDVADAARVVHVLQPLVHAHGPLDAEQARRVVDVDERQRAVVFVVPGREGAHQRELAQARHHAGRRGLAAGGDDGDLVPDLRAEQPRKLHADDDVPLAGLELRQQRGAVTREVGDLAFFGGVDAAHDGAAQVVTAAEQRLCHDEGRRADHARVFGGLGRGGLPVGQG
ncbi:MAG: hypothetical protein ACOVOI_16655, partial [Hyphomicrobiales bacterium]